MVASRVMIQSFLIFVFIAFDVSAKDCSIQGQFHNQGPVVIKNVDIFDGKENVIRKNSMVLIDYVRTPDSYGYDGALIKGSDVGYFIKEISANGQLISKYDQAGARIIDGKGLTLMPGLIDSHTHLSWADINPLHEFSKKVAAGIATFEDWPPYGAEASIDEARNRLMDGFTTIREVGGVAHMIKKCVDPFHSSSDNVAYEGLPGPRIVYAGSVISPTSGHADIETDLDEKFHYIPDLGTMTASQREDLILQADRFGLYKADGVPGISKAVRTQFTKSAQFIKIATGGGIVSPNDPVFAKIMTDDEVSVATQITDGMHTYTTTHSYTGDTIMRDIRHGVQMIEHANLINKQAMKLVKTKQSRREKVTNRDTSVWLNISPFFQNQYDGSSQLSGYNLDKLRVVEKSTLNAFALAKKYKVRNMAWGSDVMFLPGGATIAAPMIAQMPLDLAPLKRFKIDGDSHYGNYAYSNYDILKMVTYNNGLVVTKSGPLTPYLGVDGSYLKEGLIGHIAPNAVADLILVKGNPLNDLSFLSNPSKNIQLIMKDGIIYKNTLH